MAYVQRDQAGRVTGRCAIPQPGYAEEWLDDSDPELQISVKDKLLPDLRARREVAMNAMDGLQTDALTIGDTETALAIRAAKAACKNLPALGVSSATSETEMRGLYLAEWRRIAGSVPAPVRIAFAAVLA